MAELYIVNKLKCINIALYNATDKQIIDIYNIFAKNIKSKDKALERQKMVQTLLEKICLVDDDTVDSIYDYVDENELVADMYMTEKEKREIVLRVKSLKNKTKIKVNTKSKSKSGSKSKKKAKVLVKKKIDKDDDIENDEDVNDEKYQMVLKFVNGLLKNSGKEPIAKLTDFVDIDRLDIVTDENKEYIEEIADELFEHFDRKACRYYPRNSKSRPLNILRGIVDDTGYNLIAARKEVYEGKYRRSAMIYTIKKTG